ncbi:MAG: PEP-utilizing enzyme [Deltaproteobacteria bacterium]
MTTNKRFPSPFDIETPKGAEGWEEMYTYSLLFSDDRREYEDDAFWFHDSVHWGEPMPPWDTIHIEYAFQALGQANSRVFVVPPALGVSLRLLNGYSYVSPIQIGDPATIEARVPEFMERAGHYFQNWDALYDKWLGKVKKLVADVKAIDFSPLPEREPIENVKSGRGVGVGRDLMRGYQDLLDHVLTMWHYHFELLNLGYAAYLDFFGFCKKAFPNIPDLAVARMVAGIDIDLFRPDRELKGLAQMAIDEGLKDAFSMDDPAEVEKALQGSKLWDKFTSLRNPWFEYSDGTGLYHTDKVWNDHLEVPFRFIRDYISRIEEGAKIEQPIEKVREERDRIIAEYRSMLSEDDQEAFDQKVGLAGLVFPYVENHNFYIEHFTLSTVWRKMRELGNTFVEANFFDNADDVFMLKRDEVSDAIWDMVSAWSYGAEPRGPKYWRPIVKRRREILAVLKKNRPERALGQPPEVVTEPFTVMLWGITADSMKVWLGGDDDDGSLNGFAASAGVIEGKARVVFEADDINAIEPGEILVAPVTAPSWGPAFNRIAAAVTDIGGMMSHAAILCREYGLPAVTGTGHATSKIQTGQMLRVDGATGTVTVL